MSLTYRVESPAPRDAWLRVLEQDERSLADQSPRWTDAICASGGFRDVSRYYEFSDGREAVLPLLARGSALAEHGLQYSMPPSWGMGGLVGRAVDGQAVQAVLDDMLGLGALRISLRPDPLMARHWSGLSSPHLNRVARFAHIIDLAGGQQKVESRIAKTARRGIRKAERSGVMIRAEGSDVLLAEHYRLYELSVERWAKRQHEPLPLARWRARRRDPLEKLEAMARHLGPAFCQLVAYLDGVIVASSILLLGRSAHSTRGAIDVEKAGPVRASELLQLHEIRHAQQYGARYLHLGESGTSVSLAHFKEKFGAVGYSYDEVRLERMPFTAVDLALRRSVKRMIGFKDT